MFMEWAIVMTGLCESMHLVLHTLERHRSANNGQGDGWYKYWKPKQYGL